MDSFRKQKYEKICEGERSWKNSDKRPIKQKAKEPYVECDYLSKWNEEHPEEYMDLRLRTAADEIDCVRMDKQASDAQKRLGKKPTSVDVAQAAGSSIPTNEESFSVDDDFDSFVKSRAIKKVTPTNDPETRDSKRLNPETIDKLTNLGSIQSSLLLIKPAKDFDINTPRKRYLNCKRMATTITGNASAKTTTQGSEDDPLWKRIIYGLGNTKRTDTTLEVNSDFGLLVLYDTLLGLEPITKNGFYKPWENIKLVVKRTAQRVFSAP